MPNKNLFRTKRQRIYDPTTENEAGGKAYDLGPEASLAQLAVTNTFGGTYYVNADDQLLTVLKLCKQVSPKYIAQLALYAREKGYMKDMPAFLLAYLTTVDVKLAEQIAPRIIHHGRMLRNFVQFLRSGAVGRTSLGSAPKRMVRTALGTMKPMALFRAAIGKNPSIADVIKMVHPKPKDEWEKHLFAYLIGKEHDGTKLPAPIVHYEAFKSGDVGNPPDVDFRYLSSLKLTGQHWKEIARNARWMMTRMNLNTFKRHGVLDDPEMVELIAKRLESPEEIKGAMAFPYQLLMAYKAASEGMPRRIKDALHNAMEMAVDNVPPLKGRTLICVDCSSSMGGPITGGFHATPTQVRCVDVAGLIGASILRSNPDAKVVLFDSQPYPIELEPRDTIMTNAKRMARRGGATYCGVALGYANRRWAPMDNVIYVSDMESWFGNDSRWGGRGPTSMAQEFKALKGANPKAKMACIDIQPHASAQAPNTKDIMNIGGFSDQVFTVLKNFFEGDTLEWIRQIEAIDL